MTKSKTELESELKQWIFYHFLASTNSGVKDNIGRYLKPKVIKDYDMDRFDAHEQISICLSELYEIPEPFISYMSNAEILHQETGFIFDNIWEVIEYFGLDSEGLRFSYGSVDGALLWKYAETVAAFLISPAVKKYLIDNWRDGLYYDYRHFKTFILKLEREK